MNNKKMINDFSILSGELNYFLAVYEQKTINAAARKLGMDAGNISRAIQKIEQTTKENLFVRHKNGLTPTALGDRFYNAIIQAQKKFSNEIQSDQIGRQIKIGFNSTVGYQHFSPKMTEILMKSNFEPQFTLESSSKLIELLQRRELDFALVHSPIKFPGLISRPVNSEGIVLTSISTKPSETLVLHPDMLAAERLLYSIKHSKRWLIKDYFMIAKLLEHNSSLMGLVPESLLGLHPLLKILKVYGNAGKITALSWPGSPGVALFEGIDR